MEKSIQLIGGISFLLPSLLLAVSCSFGQTNIDDCLNFEAVRALSLTSNSNGQMVTKRYHNFDFAKFQSFGIVSKTTSSYFDITYDKLDEVTKISYVDKSREVFSEITFDVLRNDKIVLFKVSLKEGSEIVFPTYVICRKISTGEYFLINYKPECCPYQDNRYDKFCPLGKADEVSAIMNLDSNLKPNFLFRISEGRIMSYSIFENLESDLTENILFLDFKSITKIGAIDDTTCLDILYRKVKGRNGVFISAKPTRNNSLPIQFFWVYGGVHRYNTNK